MSEDVKLYESQALRTVTGPTIRPGGLALTDRALAFLRFPRGAMVLDVGCGTGATVAHLRYRHGLRAFGMDTSRRLLDAGRSASGGLPLIRGRAEKLPFSDGCLSAIFCECVLSLLSDPQAALREWHRVLAPRGHLIVSDLYERDGEVKDRPPWGPPGACLAGIASLSALFEHLRGTDFEVLTFEDHTPFLTQLAARLVWTYGSLDAFWSAAGATCRAKGGRPGFYLMMARKCF